MNAKAIDKYAVAGRWAALVFALALALSLGLGLSITFGAHHGGRGVSLGRHHSLVRVQMDGSWAESYKTLHDLKAASDLVMLGTVTSVGPSEDRGRGLVFTDSVVSVERVIKPAGPPSLATITVHQTGGMVGAYEYEMEGDPVYRVNERLFLFLRQYAPGRYYTVAGPQGRFELVNGQVLTPDPATAVPSLLLPLPEAQFIQVVQNA